MGALNGGRAHKLEGVLENEDSSLAEVLDELEEHGGGDYSAHFISSEPDLAELASDYGGGILRLLLLFNEFDVLSEFGVLVGECSSEEGSHS